MWCNANSNNAKQKRIQGQFLFKQFIQLENLHGIHKPCFLNTIDGMHCWQINSWWETFLEERYHVRINHLRRAYCNTKNMIILMYEKINLLWTNFSCFQFVVWVVILSLCNSIFACYFSRFAIVFLLNCTIFLHLLVVWFLLHP